MLSELYSRTRLQSLKLTLDKDRHQCKQELLFKSGQQVQDQKCSQAVQYRRETHTGIVYRTHFLCMRNCFDKNDFISFDRPYLSRRSRQTASFLHTRDKEEKHTSARKN